MAFFKGENGVNYFNCFYRSNKNNLVTGIFYELSREVAYWLSMAYKIASILAILFFIMELFLPMLLARLNADGRDFVLAVFFVFDSVLVLPLAFILVRKKRILLEEKRFLLKKEASVSVYLCVIFIPINYALNMIWKAHFDTPSNLLFFVIVMALMSTASAIFRLHQMAKFPLG